MPPKRCGRVSSSQRTRRGTRPQPTAQIPSKEVYDALGISDSPAASGGGNSRDSSVAVTEERVAADLLRPSKEGTRGGVESRRGGGKGKGRVKGRKVALEEEVLDVYQDMLKDVVDTSTKRPEEASDSEEGGPLKRRKVVWDGSNKTGPSSGEAKGKEILVEDTEDDTIENGNTEAESEESFDESELDWEEVDLSRQPAMNITEPPKDNQPLLLILDQKEKQKSGPARRIITAVDRRIRLEVHKVNLLCLLIQVYQRSRWCNNSIVKENLRLLIPKDVNLLLNPDPNDQQFRRSHNFLEGLKKVSEMWQKRFRITHRGASKPRWNDTETLKIVLANPLKDGDPPMKINDFLVASARLAGSRDLGAQLFCALLRSAGVTCRLVCSLQPLSFTFQDKWSKAKQAPTIPIAALQDEEDTSNDEPCVQVNNRFGGPGIAAPAITTRGRGLRMPRFREPIIKPPKPKKATPIIIRESAYPVYWVEAWNMATQKWIAVDPLVTSTVGKPSKIEPPMSDVENIMSYVIAFEEEGQAQDVTRRYAKSYNGKTRKLRVSCTKGGSEWWDCVLKVFQRGWGLDRDQLELAELLQREVLEPIPNNIQDLKGHPLFALKRHLKRGEIIHPEKSVGSVTTGTGNKKVTETIFRRQDVKAVRSSGQWYRLGRELKPGEQPLKYIAARPRLKRGGYDVGNEMEDEEREGDRQTAMYAEFQTVLYKPPAVFYGKVPKNSFGNLDIFVPSMVPKGGVHLPYKGIAKAARLLGVDYAEAVTGFEFKNRQASAITSGIVVAQEYQESVEAVMEGLIDEQNEAEELKKSVEALKKQRRLLMELKIRERLGILPGDTKMGPVESGMIKEDKKESKVDEGEKDTAGEFFAEVGEDGNGDNSRGGGCDGGGFIPEDDEGENGGGGFIPGNDDGDDGFLSEEIQSEKGESDMEILEDSEDEDLDWF